MDEDEQFKRKVENLSGSVAARVRQLMPAIERQLENRVSLERIAAALREEGLSVTATNLKMTLYRERKRRKAQPAAETEEVIATAVVEGPPPLAAAPDRPEQPVSQSPRSQQEEFEDALDPEKRAAKADRYLTQRTPLIGRAKGTN